MHGLQINKAFVAKATAAYTTGDLQPEDEVTLKDKDGNPKTVTVGGKEFKTYSPKKELNKIVAKEYLGAETKGDVATELRIRSHGPPFHVADSD